MVPLAALAGIARVATVARAVTPMISRTPLGRFGMSRVFPFLKDTLKKGVGLIKRGGRSVGRKIPGAAFLLKGLGGLFGGKDNQEGGEFLQPQQEGDALSASAGGSEALGAALPTTRNANVPSLPSYKSGKEGETIVKLLSIAVKYLAGIDASLKNQLDVQRASFTQTNQMAREKSLEGGDGAETAKPTSSIVTMMKRTGSGVLSFFSSMLMKTLLLTAPLIIKKISDMVDGFDFDFGDTDEETKPKDTAMPQNGMAGDRPLTRRGRRDDIPSRLNATESGEAIKNVLKREGGYVNDPADKGGETKFGISKRAYPNLDIKNLTEAQASTIYKRDYWDKINADELPANIREMAFDSAVNHGVSWTKEALRKSNNDPQKFLALRKEKYQNIVAKDPSQGKFLKGWMNRLGDFNAAPAETPMMAAASLVTTPPAASTRINEAAVDRAARESGVATTPTTPAPVVVAQNAPPPNSTTVTSGGPGDPSSVSSDRTLMTWIQYFSPLPA